MNLKAFGKSFYLTKLSVFLLFVIMFLLGFIASGVYAIHNYRNSHEIQEDILSSIDIRLTEHSDNVVSDLNSFADDLDPSINLLVSDTEVSYMYGLATAYHPPSGGINSDSDPTVTSQMKPAKEGVIAVNPEVIPYGSEVMIIHEETVIRGRALDTGGFAENNPHQVDILMECLEEANEWGRKNVHIIWW